MSKTLTVNYKGILHDGDTSFCLMFEVQSHDEGEDPDALFNWFSLLIWGDANSWLSGWSLQMRGQHTDLPHSDPTAKHLDGLWGNTGASFWHDAELSPKGVEHAILGVRGLFNTGVLTVDDCDGIELKS